MSFVRTAKHELPRVAFLVNLSLGNCIDSIA